MAWAISLELENLPMFFSSLDRDGMSSDQNSIIVAECRPVLFSYDTAQLKNHLNAYNGQMFIEYFKCIVKNLYINMPDRVSSSDCIFANQGNLVHYISLTHFWLMSPLRRISGLVKLFSLQWIKSITIYGLLDNTATSVKPRL